MPTCDAQSLVTLSAARGYAGLAERDLLYAQGSQSTNFHPIPVPTSVVILPDGSGGFWRVIVSINGDVYLQSDPGPATADVILADGGGGFWKLTASVAGDRYGVSNAGPATVAPVILDANLVAWTLTVDTLGDITATS